MAAHARMSEAEFTKLAKQTYERIESAFDDVDPDHVECEGAQDALTLTLPAKFYMSQAHQSPPAFRRLRLP